MHHVVLRTSLTASVLIPLVALLGCTTSPSARPDAATEPPVPPALTAPDAVIDAVVDAYGGETALGKLRAFRVEGELEAHVRGFSGHIRRDFVAPANYRVEITYPEGSEIRILAGRHSWRGNAEQQPAVGGPPRQAMVYQLLRSTLPGPLVQFRTFIELVGRGEFEQRPTYLLRLPNVEGVQVQYWVDAESFRVVRVQGNFRAGPMMLDFATTYDDFREVEGALVSFHEENYANYNHTGTTVLKQVVFSPQNPGPFAPGTAL